MLSRSSLRLSCRLPRLTTSFTPSPIRIANFTSTQIKMSVQAINSYEEFQKIIAELQDFNSTSNTEKGDDNSSDSDDPEDPYLQEDFFSQFH